MAEFEADNHDESEKMPQGKDELKKTLGSFSWLKWAPWLVTGVTALAFVLGLLLAAASNADWSVYLFIALIGIFACIVIYVVCRILASYLLLKIHYLQKATKEERENFILK